MSQVVMGGWCTRRGNVGRLVISAFLIILPFFKIDASLCVFITGNSSGSFLSSPIVISIYCTLIAGIILSDVICKVESSVSGIEDSPR